MAGLVLRDDSEGVAVLTLHRPDVLNALSPKLFEELRAHVDQAITQSGASGPSDIGAAMRAAMAAVAGRADGRRVSELVKGTLSG